MKTEDVETVGRKPSFSVLLYVYFLLLFSIIFYFLGFNFALTADSCNALAFFL